MNPRQHIQQSSFAERCDRGWRVLATGFAFFLFGFGALDLGIFLGFFLLLMPAKSPRRARIVRGAIRFFCRFYLWVLKALGLLTYRCHGFEALDARGKLVIANHPTLLDAVFLMGLIPSATFVVKAAMTRHTFIGGIARLAGYLPNDRDGLDLLERACEALSRGETLVIFPEGTRSSGGTAPFKRGAANIALASGCDIVPVHIRCEPITLQKNRKWYDVPPRKPHFVLRVLPEVAPRQCIDTNRPLGIQARQLTQYLQGCLAQVEPAVEPAVQLPLGA